MKTKISIVLTAIALSLVFFNSCDKIEKIDGNYNKPVYTDKMNFAEYYDDAAALSKDSYDKFYQNVTSHDAILSMVVLSGDASAEGNSSAAEQLKSLLSIDNSQHPMVFNRIQRKGAYGILSEEWKAIFDQASSKGKVKLDIKGAFKASKFTGSFVVNSTAKLQKKTQLSMYIVRESMEVNGATLNNVLVEDSLNIAVANTLEKDKDYTVPMSYSLMHLDPTKKYRLLVCVEESDSKAILQAKSFDLSENTAALTFYEKQKVLVEDFTGQKCGNCPKGHLALKEIMEANGDKVVGMAIHYGYFAEPDGEYPTDFRTSVGDAIAEGFSVALLPIGLVNRVGETGSKLKPYAEWATLVQDELNKTPKVGIALNAEVSGSNISAAVSVKAFEESSSQYKIQLFVTESKIVSKQLFYGQTPPEIEDYEHEHVLRATMNGNWGEKLNNGTFAKDEIISKNFSIAKKADWKAENLSVIAIVYDEASQAILQVEEVKFH